MMKTKDNSNNKEKDKSKLGHENQNIRDFNPSQFIEEDDVDIKNKKDKKENKKDKRE